MHSRARRGRPGDRRGRAGTGIRPPSDEREAALLRYLKALLEDGGRPPMHLHEEAREAGWDDEQILEAIAALPWRALPRWLT